METNTLVDCLAQVRTPSKKRSQGSNSAGVLNIFRCLTESPGYTTSDRLSSIPSASSRPLCSTSLEQAHPWTPQTYYVLKTAWILAPCRPWPSPLSLSPSHHVHGLPPQTLVCIVPDTPSLTASFLSPPSAPESHSLAIPFPCHLPDLSSTLWSSLSKTQL